MKSQLVSETEKLDRLIYSPTDAVTATTQYIESNRQAIESGLGLLFPIDSIAQEYPIPPITPGSVFTVEAVTSHGKSTFKEFWIGNAADRIRGNESNEHVIISISAEDMVEEQMADTMRREAAIRGDVESVTMQDGLLEIAAHIGSVPIYYIGMSIARAGMDVPPMNMTNAWLACERIKERRKDKNINTVFMGVFLDYIQAMDLDKELMATVADKRRHLQVSKDFKTFRRLCASLPAPGVCLAQCKTVLSYAPGKNMQTPGLLDIQESSAVAQHTDRAISLWMPKNTHSMNEVLEHGNMKFKVIPNLVWMRCTKQRGRDPLTLKGLPSGRHWPLWLNFDTGEYYPIDKPEDTLMVDVQTRYERRLAQGKDPLADSSM